MLIHAIKNLIGATQFMTIIPVGKKPVYDPEGMVPFFPLVGLFIGILLSVFDQLVLRLWTAQVAALLDVIFLVWISGALHLDGLGDTADGLYGKRSRDQALAIMKDSRIGAMGVIAILCGLLVKWAGISGLTEYRSLLLILIPSFSRAGVLFGLRFFNYGRPEGGTGKDFFNRRIRIGAFLGLLLPVGISFYFDICYAIQLISFFILIILIILGYYKVKIGVITGDMLGAMIEITESGLFLMISAGGAIR